MLCQIAAVVFFFHFCSNLKDIVLIAGICLHADLDGTGCADFSGDAVSLGTGHSSDLRVGSIGSGQFKFVFELIVPQLRGHNLLTHGTAGLTDDGLGLRTVLVPCHHSAQFNLDLFAALFALGTILLALFPLLFGLLLRTDLRLGKLFHGGAGIRLWCPLHILIFLFLRDPLRGRCRFAQRAAALCAVLTCHLTAAGTFGVRIHSAAVAGVALALAGLQDGDLLDLLLQNGILQLGVRPIQRRQPHTDCDSGSQHNAAHPLHGFVLDPLFPIHVFISFMVL